MYYHVFLALHQTIRVTINGDSSQHDFNIYILNSAFQAETNSYNYQYPESVTFTAKTEGYVYILVVPYSGSGDFTISLEYLDIAPLPEWLLWLIIIGVAAAVIGGIFLFFKFSR